MKKGKHPKLLRMICRNLGQEFGEHRGGEISDARPGTQDYDNKCTFRNARYIAVKQDPNERKNGNRVNTLAFGHRCQEPQEYAPFPLSCWDPDYDELKRYADKITPWVRECLTRDSGA